MFVLSVVGSKVPALRCVNGFEFPRVYAAFSLLSFYKSVFVANSAIMETARALFIPLVLVVPASI